MVTLVATQHKRNVSIYYFIISFLVGVAWVELVIIVLKQYSKF